MYRVDHPSAVPTLAPPTAPTSTPNRFFFGGNPATNQLATVVEDEWLNMVQEELCNAVIASGLTLSKSNRNQLSQAISLISGGGLFLPITGGTLSSPGNLTVNGTITPIGGIVGVVNASNAVAGHIGEYRDMGANAPPGHGGRWQLNDNTMLNVVTMDLPPGDWDVWGSASITFATVPPGPDTADITTDWRLGIGTDAQMPSLVGAGAANWGGWPDTAIAISIPVLWAGGSQHTSIASTRFNLATQTTIYLRTIYWLDGMNRGELWGYLMARRAR